MVKIVQNIQLVMKQMSRMFDKFLCNILFTNDKSYLKLKTNMMM